MVAMQSVTTKNTGWDGETTPYTFTLHAHLPHDTTAGAQRTTSCSCLKQVPVVSVPYQEVQCSGQVHVNDNGSVSTNPLKSSK